MAESLNIPCTLEVCDIASVCQQEKGSVEEIARRERYNFIEKVCVANHAKHVAVAHHADDNAETVLHRILRGTGFARALAVFLHQEQSGVLVTYL